ncbi:MAG: hypothetical protein IPL65_22410 [Lewinellaceae bacterium]|nr:hypothetical protein [Lewinellaceae bacterium]
MVDVKAGEALAIWNPSLPVSRQRNQHGKAGTTPAHLIDQVEEIFISRDSLNANEQTALANALNQMLADFPNLKLCLSFREEYLARIRELLKVNPSYFDFFCLHEGRGAFREPSPASATTQNRVPATSICPLKKTSPNPLPVIY